MFGVSQISYFFFSQFKRKQKAFFLLPDSDYSLIFSPVEQLTSDDMNRLDLDLLLLSNFGVDDAVTVVVVLDGITNPSTTPTTEMAAAAAAK